MPPEDDAPATVPSPTIVAWNWVIEALADIKTDKECRFPTLAELIKRVKGVLKDPILGAAPARERVALRFLEECVDLGCAKLPSPSMQEESDDVVFDVNERIDSVLCKFLQKVNNLDSKEMSKGATYIHGLQRFICEKKSTLPDVFLSTLKDADFLHECSPFMMGDIGVVEGKLEDNSDASPEKNLKENAVELTNDGVQVTTGPYLVDNPTALRNDLSVHQKHSSTDTTLDGHRDDVHPKRHAETSKSFDLRTSGYQDEHVNGVPREVPSPKLHACCSVQVTNGPHLVDNGLTLQNNLSEHQKHSTKTALDGHRDPIDVEDDIHPRREADTLKSSKRNTNNYQDKHANRTTMAVPSSNMHVCSPEVHDKSHEVLSDGDGSLDMQKKEKFPFMEKCKSPTLQILSNLLSEDATQKGLCIKCNEGGELLMCSESDCPLAVHGSCVGLGKWFDDLGNLICPLCPLRRSILLQTMLAFLNSGPVERASPQEPVLSKNPNGLKKMLRQSPADEDYANQDNIELSVWTLRNRRLKNLVVNDTTKNSGHFEGGIQCVGYQHKLPLHNTDVATNCGGLMNANNHILPVNGGNNRSSDAQCTEMEPCQEIVEFRKLGSDDLAFSRATTTKNDARDDLCNKHGGEGSKRNDCHRNKRERSNVQEEATTGSSNLSPFEEMMISGQSTKRTEDVHTPQTGDSSSKYKSSKKRPKRYANPVLPCGRRNTLPWTTEEEEVLKEAVQKFNNSKGVFQWRTILEHGHHLFHRTRSPGDLKDKWRNMQKREEKALKR